MSHTGTYVHVPGQGVVKVSDQVPTLSPNVWSPKGDLPYYDKAAQRTFESKADKRRWMAETGMKESGELVNPNKHIGGRTRSCITPERRKAQQMFQAQLARDGGVNGLLDRLQRTKGGI